MNLSKQTDNKSFKIIFAASLIVYAAACFYLFYNQLVSTTPSLFSSDTSVHVRMAVEDGFLYSLNSYIYLLFSKTPFMNVGIACFLTISTVFSVYLTYILIKRIVSLYSFKVKDSWLGLLAFMCNFVMGFYVKFLNAQHYIGYQNANMWHNSTYIVMRVCAVATLILFVDMYVQKPDTAEKLVFFSIMLAVTTAFKPSFATVFCPFMALLLLYDWIIKKEKFMRIFTRALTVVPSLFVIVIESKVFFGAETGNGYEIAPFVALSERGDHPKAALILSILFPLTVFIVHITDFYKDKIYCSSLVIWLMGFLLVFFLRETGSRSGDGNFLWGYSIALFVLFTASALKVLKDIKIHGFFKDKNIIFDLYVIASIVLFLWHVISGIWYFILLLGGNTYFI
ncbi:MAG: hypothetical protein J6X36_08350 [Lachnospiraceae bacterium]|nr:hypothetical protein [Lachnospiraceae bacterium]